MKTEVQLNQDILELTLAIEEKHPELSKYLAEMPVTIPINPNPTITPKTLQTYYNSLNSLLENYILAKKN
jgi:hypothetical protein